MGNSESREEHNKSPNPNKHLPPHNRLERTVSRDVARKLQQSSSQYSHAAPKPSVAVPSSSGSGSNISSNHPLPTSLVPPTSTASTTTTREHAIPAQSHTRARSVTSSIASRTRGGGEEAAGSHVSSKSESMGQSQSSEQQKRPPSRSQTLPPTPNAEANDEKAQDIEKTTSSPSAQPVDVPQPHEALSEKEEYVPQPRSESPYTSGVPPASARYDRPPRLPLPIEEEVHTPGSPILSSATGPELPGSPLEHHEVDGGILPRRTSVLSSTTADDEEIGDNDAFITSEAHSLAPTVPTTISWRGGAVDKVYVTGTIVNWERKFKLHPDEVNGGFSAALQLKPGTHHLKFLVGGDMITSDALPTTVDYTNILVNYIEVVAPLPEGAEQTPKPAEPMPIPGTAKTDRELNREGGGGGGASDERSRKGSETVGALPSTLQEVVGHAAPRPTPVNAQSQSLPAAPTPRDEPSTTAASKPPPPTKHRLPRPQYTSDIPAFLLDLDTSNPDDPKLARAKSVEASLPTPPSLPMFMGKSILNGATPHKDDASALIMPNHTVLNHLATSSIKSGVLATSGTTRYRRKFLTTIMYKPTSDS